MMIGAYSDDIASGRDNNIDGYLRRPSLIRHCALRPAGKIDALCWPEVEEAKRLFDSQVLYSH